MGPEQRSCCDAHSVAHCQLARLQATLGYFLASSWDLFTVLSVPSDKIEAALQTESIIASSMYFRLDVYGNCLNDMTVMSSM